MPRQHRLHNITRYEHHYFRGWRVELKRQGKQYRRYFKDDSDRAMSLARVLAWRDRMMAQLPPPRRFQLHKKPTRTGVVGVSYSRDITRSGTAAPRYRVAWTDEHGRIYRRSFAVLTYGERKARTLAVRLRKHALVEMLQPSRRATGRRRGRA